MSERRRRASLRAAYLRSLSRERYAREENDELRRDLDAAIDALIPSIDVMRGDRYALHERVEDEVRRYTPLPGLVCIGLASVIRWGRA